MIDASAELWESVDIETALPSFCVFSAGSLWILYHHAHQIALFLLCEREEKEEEEAHLLFNAIRIIYAQYG